MDRPLIFQVGRTVQHADDRLRVDGNSQILEEHEGLLKPFMRSLKLLDCRCRFRVIQDSSTCKWTPSLKTINNEPLNDCNFEILQFQNFNVHLLSTSELPTILNNPEVAMAPYLTKEIQNLLKTIWSKNWSSGRKRKGGPSGILKFPKKV